MELAEIRTYPIKSTKGILRPSAQVLPWGLEGDRRWAAVDPLGEVIWVGEHPRLLSVSATETPEGGLRLSAKGMDELKVPPATGDTIPAGFSNLDRAVLAHADAHEWFTRLLGKPARLIWLDTRRRTMTEEHGGLWDAPLLLISRSSLQRLDDWIAEDAMERQEHPPDPLDIARFRPNAVIDGAEPFAEDAWTSVRIGEIDMKAASTAGSNRWARSQSRRRRRPRDPRTSSPASAALAPRTAAHKPRSPVAVRSGAAGPPPPTDAD
ncbi:MOSC domain-containing protein [Streptosporangium sp. NBC_01756]|uniref:MOSC domain-containing protein n=1 Tax=Streptosporangium sp. NBC_01756 TaxID=2975950 RepID=UPI002DD9A6E9|nr:MOSC N-terminal beta barrel domain-containing protein [Streptosporangium sp. NBC_01756]WSC85805.1 MOSC N-terminal beta barrel domain-containing protein [Streptosporangium sp. NBC_01756]